MHGPDELEAEGVIRGFMRRITGGSGAGDPAAELSTLRAEVERLTRQSESMKQAMRHCISCEYRLEVVAKRGDKGLSADGSPATLSEHGAR